MPPRGPWRRLVPTQGGRAGGAGGLGARSSFTRPTRPPRPGPARRRVHAPAQLHRKHRLRLLQRTALRAPPAPLRNDGAQHHARWPPRAGPFLPQAGGALACQAPDDTGYRAQGRSLLVPRGGGAAQRAGDQCGLEWRRPAVAQPLRWVRACGGHGLRRLAHEHRERRGPHPHRRHRRGWSHGWHLRREEWWLTARRGARRTRQHPLRPGCRGSGRDRRRRAPTAAAHAALALHARPRASLRRAREHRRGLRGAAAACCRFLHGHDGRGATQLRRVQRPEGGGNGRFQPPSPRRGRAGHGRRRPCLTSGGARHDASAGRAAGGERRGDAEAGPDHDLEPPRGGR